MTHTEAATGGPGGMSRAMRRVVRLAAAILLVEAAALAAWRTYDVWRAGRVTLNNDGPPLIVQVLDESGEAPIGEPVVVLTKAELSLPDGDYRLRVNGMGFVGRTFRLAVNRGETGVYHLSLDEGRLLGRGLAPKESSNQEPEKPREVPIPAPIAAAALELSPGRSDLVEFNGETLIRRDAATGRPIWDASRPKVAFPPGRDPARWLRRISDDRRTIQFIDPAPDLDGDGTRDVLLVVVDANAFLALSGKDGSMLWNHAAGLDGTGGPQPEGPTLPGPFPQPSRPGRVIGGPEIHDLDDDGIPDLIATLQFWEFPAETTERAGEDASTEIFQRRTVQAISGRSGRSLWSHPIDLELRSLRQSVLATALVRGRGASTVVIVVDQEMTRVDPATGRPRSAPIDLGFVPVRPVQTADLDGDGEPELLVLGPGPKARQQSLAALEAATGRPRWTTIVSLYLRNGMRSSSSGGWPWLVDLDADGRPEIVVPDSGPLPPASRYRGLQCLDGASGRPRWVHPMHPDTIAANNVNHVLDAPDLDGDGTRDLIAVSVFQGRYPPVSRTEPRLDPIQYHVDALSGRSGRRLWSWHADPPDDKVVHLRPPLWWGRGPDGWPLLAIPIGRSSPQGSDWGNRPSPLLPPTVYALESSTGRLLHEIPGLTRAAVADLDGDGLADLWGEAGGLLRAFRGELPEAWRALGQLDPTGRIQSSQVGGLLRPTDLDGDGTGDPMTVQFYTRGDATAEPTGSRTAVARSGRDGHLLWKVALEPSWLGLLPEHARSYSLSTHPLPSGDLDGDGTPDVIAEKNPLDTAEIGLRPATLPLMALSGRNGRFLWSAGPLPLGFEAHGYTQVKWVEPRVIEPGAGPDLVVSHRSPFLQASPAPRPSTSDWLAQERVARVSGRTGRILWDIAVEEKPVPERSGGPAPAQFDDLDGDGRLDAALIAPRALDADGAVEHDVRILSLHDGKTLWTRPLGRGPHSPQFELTRGNGGRPQVLISEIPFVGASNEMVLTAHDGRDGTVLWTWRSGIRVGDRRVTGWIQPMALDGETKDALAVTYCDFRRESHIVLVDARGHARADRTFPPEADVLRKVPAVRDMAADLEELSWFREFPPVRDMAADLDGDGRDEILVWHDDRLFACGRDLKDLWTIPDAANAWPITAIPGRPGTLVIPPMTGLDGPTGRARWTDRTPMPDAIVLDPGAPTRPPLIVSPEWRKTVVRSPLPTTGRGVYAPPSGARVPPGPPGDDPRWTRPLPWTTPIRRYLGRRVVVAVVALAMFDVVLPVALLWLAARRRPWTIRLLMALPIAAAVPLTVLQVIEPMLPAQIGTRPVPTGAVFAIATLAGLPIVAGAGVIAWSLVRLRWKPIAAMAGLAIVAAAIIAAAWIGVDRRAMPAIEHYDRSQWYLAAIPGTYAAGALMLVAWPLRAAYRLIRPSRSPVEQDSAA